MSSRHFLCPNFSLVSLNLSGFVNKKSFTPLRGEQILWDRIDFSIDSILRALPEAPNLVFLTNNCRLPSKISLFFSSIGVINNAAMKKAAVPSILVAVVLLAVAVIAEAQQPKKVPKIGYLTGASPSFEAHRIEGFRQGLRDLSYIEGENILVEYRYAEGNLDRIPGLVGELVQLKVDVLVSGNFQAIRTAKQASKTIPIVMVTTVDPVATGLVDSLARPGGNITGLTKLTRELSGKRLELLKEAVSG